MTAYDASKGAVRILTQAAAREAATSGVRVNAVAPGTVETDLTLGLASAADLAALGEARVPLGRLGLPEEIASAVEFLSSDCCVVRHRARARGRRRLARMTSSPLVLLRSAGARRRARLTSKTGRFTMRTFRPPCERPLLTSSSAP